MIVVPVLTLFLRRLLPQVFSGLYEVRSRGFYSCGASGSAGPTVNDALPQVHPERVVAGALIEDPAWLRDESFDLDLIGFDATDLEPSPARADGEAGSDDAED